MPNYEEFDPEDDSSHARLLIRAGIEKTEFKYLKAIASGPGYPVFWIMDLTEELALKYARQVMTQQAIDTELEIAEKNGFVPIVGHCSIQQEPYEVGDHPWKDCPRTHFPIVAVAEGRVSVFARAVPDGIDEALRKRLLASHGATIGEAARNHPSLGNEGIVVFVADLKDPVGRRVAEASLGLAEVERMLDSAQGAASVVVTTAGIPTSSNYPAAWGGPPPPGSVHVQVAAHGGLLSATVPIGAAEPAAA